jgi:hypothetical protein
MDFDSWLADLCVVSEEYGYVGNIVEDTGCEYWQDYYDNEESPGSAFFDFKFSQ